ncbi:amidase signature enzyme [Hesseltinella vesiculosa]|uniref:Amidase signature enzyme n=1 Tax=Hesseltinella vesiculosa TaxID=101127 RepID=A0A1X2GV87_9FUNG|nr:amidase signature enzyme [Hesseltinella vesiculosa]
MTTRTKVSTPELYGWPLIAAANALEMLPFVANKIARDGAMLDLRDCNDIDEIPTTLALPENYILNNNKATSAPTAIPKLQEETKSRSHYLSFWDYHDAYMHKKTTPTQVAKNLIAAVEAHQKYHWIRSYSKEQILKQAEASTLRYELGQPLSQLDGVFIPVKEELDVVGLETKFGTSFINDGKPATENATLVQRLMNAGVIILGHTVMNELGWDTFTVNPATGMPANPFDISSSCGGSSGGSAGVVASGIVPVAIGCDGGGSVRIPASFCGLYGLKTTTGRVSSVGGRPVDPTVSVSGPIAATADDMALTYAVMSGVDEKDPRTRFQPVMSLENYTLTHTLEGMTIGITKTFNDLVEEPAIMDQMTHFMRYFESLGAKIVEIDIPDLAMPTSSLFALKCSTLLHATPANAANSALTPAS